MKFSAAKPTNKFSIICVITHEKNLISFVFKRCFMLNTEPVRQIKTGLFVITSLFGCIVHSFTKRIKHNYRSF